MTPEAIASYAASTVSAPLLLIAAAFACLLLPLFFRPLKSAAGGIALAATAVALLAFRRPFGAEIQVLGGALILSPSVAILWAFSTVVLLFTLIFSMADGHEESRGGEYYFLLLMAVIGLMALIGAGDLFTAFIALELLSIPLYALAGIRRTKAGLEAAYKYFMLGAFGSGLTVLGIAMVNASSPSLSFIELAKAGAPDPMQLAAFLLVISGFAFKTALVPFHMWVPDVYEGAPTQISAFMGAAVKAGGVIALWRIFSIFDYGPVREIFWWLALITFVTANFMALPQQGLKRLLAYSSVAHAGYLATAFFGGKTAMPALLYYLPVYAMATLGAFAVAQLLEKDEKGPAVEDLAGLARTRPWLAASMAAFMFSLAGVPPLAGFFAKFYAFSGAVSGGYTGLVAAAVVMSAVSAYYYLRITVVMYMKPPAAGALPPEARLAELPVYALAAGVLLAGIFSGPVMGLLIKAARFF